MENFHANFSQIKENWIATPKHNAKTLSDSLVEYSKAIEKFKVLETGDFESCNSSCGYNSVDFKHIKGAYCKKCGFVFPF